VNETRPRSPDAAAERDREIQGMLAMHGPESSEWEPGRPKLTPTTPEPVRVERATTDAVIKPLPYRTVLASWPDPWRERWGRRANALEDAGLSWRDAEGRAFLETWYDWRETADAVGRN
jgi:hypothetical protein